MSQSENFTHKQRTNSWWCKLPVRAFNGVGGTPLFIEKGWRLYL